MADLYPTEKEITLFGEKLKYPGLKDGKFTNGSFTDPKQLASFIPAETLNLILDNLGEAIKSVGLEPNNTDIDQLKKAITKSEIKQEILNDLVVFNIGYGDSGFMEDKTLTPDENGIIYSQDINLKSALAKKINQNEKNIEIINFNLIPGYNYKSGYTYATFYPATTGFLEENSKIDKSENAKFSLYYQNSINNENVALFIAIQVADDFTKDIKDLKYVGLEYGIAKTIETLSQEYKAACLKITISTGISTGNIIAYSIADLFGISETTITQYIGGSNTGAVDKTVYGGYHSVINELLVRSPTVYTSNIASYDISSKLMFGDNIKMRIKLISSLGNSINALVYRAYNVAVRYRIINNYS